MASQFLALPGMIPGMPGSQNVKGTAVVPKQVQVPTPQQPQRDSGLRRLLGNLGDALLVGSGGEPIYQPSVERRQMGEQLAQYLGAGNPELAAIFRDNPDAGLALLNMNREDKRFERTAGQDDERIGISQGQLGLGRDELAERRRQADVDAGLTTRGQDVQVQLQQMRMRDADLDRQIRVAIANGNNQAAMQLEQMRQANRIEIARLGGGDAGEVVETVEYPGEEARSEGGFLGIGATEVPATPSRTVRTTRPIAQQGSAWPTEQEWSSAPSGTVFNTPEGPMRKP